VLHIVGGVMDVGGIEMFLMNYYRHIDRNGIQFDFCIVEEGEGHFDQEIRSLGGVIYNLPSKKRHPIKHLNSLLKVLRDYRNYPVHMHLDGMNGLYGLMALLNKNKIRITHSHNTNHLTNKPVKRFVHDFFRLLNRVVNNNFAACSYDASVWLHGKRKSKNSYIILNAIEIEKFKFNKAIRDSLKIKYDLKDEIIIGHVGRFHHQKNHKFMLEIAKYLKNSNFNFKMLFIGGGDLFELVNKSILDSELKNYILLINKTTTPEIYYNVMDLFIFPSLFEGLGISLIEAQTNGLPCLASNLIPSQAIFNLNVITLPIDSSKKWSEKIMSSIWKRNQNSLNPYNIKININFISRLYIESTNNLN